MDGTRFDDLTRALARPASRRRAVAALAALASVAAGPAAAPASGNRRRRGCRPRCADGFVCERRRCACPSGVTCGGACCGAGQACEAGACVAPEPPPACIPAGAPCAGLGRACCDGRACGSGQGGGAAACHVPAGGACAATADCVFAAECVDGVCVDRQPRPEPRRECTFPPTGDADADGETLRRLAEDPAGPSPILLCPGTYRAGREIAVLRDLAIEAANPRDGAAILDGGWSGGGAADGHRVLAIGDGDAATPAVRLADLAIRNGRAVGDGGCIAVRAGSALALTDAVVSGCRAENGGGILNAGALSLAGAVVARCSASGLGGGIHNFVNGVARLERSTVRDCSAGQDGGGICNFYLGNVTLDHSTVSGCTAQAQGGGIFTVDWLTLDRSTVRNCTARTGGGIHSFQFSFDNEIRLTGSTVTNCTAVEDGGGIGNLGLATLTDCTVSGCTAGGNGGGIDNRDTVILTRSAVSGCTAGGNGGGIWNSIVLSLTASTVSGCTAGGNGGGIDNHGGSVTLEGGTRIERNGATGAGDGVHNFDDGNPYSPAAVTCRDPGTTTVCGNPGAGATGASNCDASGGGAYDGCDDVCAGGPGLPAADGSCA